jgi:hypothetical protein
MWLFHLASLDKVTPKCLWLVVIGILFPLQIVNKTHSMSLQNLGLTEQVISSLLTLLAMEGPFGKISSFLRCNSLKWITIYSRTYYIQSEITSYLFYFVIKLSCFNTVNSQFLFVQKNVFDLSPFDCELLNNLMTK